MHWRKAGEFVDRSREKVWFSFFLSLLVLLVMLLFMVPLFETNDDSTMREFVNGSRNGADIHLVFQNFILGLIYRFLYQLPGNLPWYTIFQYAVLLASFTAVTYVILRKLKGPAGFCVTALIQFYFGCECYIAMQFTKTTAIATCAGVLLLLYAAGEGEKISGRVLVCGLLLGCFGSMYRLKQSVACVALMSGIGLFILLKLLRERRGQVLRGLLPYLSVFGLFAFCVLALKCTDLFLYQKDERWSEYMEFNELRSDLLDYGMPDFEENREAYEELGITESAYRLYSRWNFYDPDKFTAGTVEKLIKMKPERKLGMVWIKNFLRLFPLNYFQTDMFYCFLILGVLWLFCGYHRRDDILAVLYQILLFGLLYFYMFFSGKYSINRVDAGLWFAMSLVAVWFLDGEKMKISWHTAGMICLVVLLICQGDWKDHWRIYYSGDGAARQAGLIETVSQDKEHLYFVKTGLISDYEAYGPLDSMPEGCLDNLCMLGGWDCNTPVIQDIMASYQVTNPYRDMVDNPSVYLVDSNIGMTMDYIREFYASNARAVQVRVLDERRTVYQIVSE